MDYKYLQEVMAKKFFYISKEKVYKWKINALNAMLNRVDAKRVSQSEGRETAGLETCLPCINKACNDENAAVSDMAKLVKSKIEKCGG
jgi:epoxyqueuosine reductase